MAFYRTLGLGAVQDAVNRADDLLMRLFRRSPAQPQEKPASIDPATDRAAVRRCFACHRVAPLYVYAENGHDYCLPCAADSYATLGLRPAGRRTEDLTLEDLIQYELGSRKAS